MKDGGRIAAAIEVLGDVEKTRRPVQDALKDWGIAHRFAGSRDRAAIGSLVFDVLRRRASLAAMMADDGPRAAVLAAYVTMWGRSVDTLIFALGDDRHAPTSLEPGEIDALRRAELPGDVAPAVAADVPDWLIGSLARAFGDRLSIEGRALAARADVDMRANLLKSDRDAVIEALSDYGAVATPWSPVGVRILNGSSDEKAPHIPSELSFKKGLFELQDEGSQIAALIAATGSGGQIVDLCAGGGGKALAIAAATANKGQIYAYDSDKRRFGDILDRISRAGARNIQVREPRRNSDALADLAGKADTVLVDAPCTGSGTWRRRPDAKWRLAPGALDLRQQEQAVVLADGARLVRPGGRLVYVTCSVLPEENEDRIAAFLTDNPGFHLSDAAAGWRAVTGVDPVEGTIRTVGDVAGTVLRLTPATTNTDGFFVAVLERAA